MGLGHSSSPLVQTSDLLVSLELFQGLLSVDSDRQEATVSAGMTVGQVGEALFSHGMALHNTGDVDVQTLAGAIATGTHGNGVALPNLATMLLGVVMVDAQGAVREKHIEDRIHRQPAGKSGGIYLS